MHLFVDATAVSWKQELVLLIYLACPVEYTNSKRGGEL